MRVAVCSDEPYAVNDVAVDELRRRGHEVEVLGAYDETMGHAGCVIRHADGAFEGGADPRSDGSVASY